MSDTDETGREARDEHPDAEREGTHGNVEPVGPRETAPMSPFTPRAAGIGAVVLVVGLAVTVAIPVAFTLG